MHVCLCGCRYPDSQKRASGALDLELCSGGCDLPDMVHWRTASTLSYWSSSPLPNSVVLQAQQSGGYWAFSGFYRSGRRSRVWHIGIKFGFTTHIFFNFMRFLVLKLCILLHIIFAFEVKSYYACDLEWSWAQILLPQPRNCWDPKYGLPSTGCFTIYFYFVSVGISGHSSAGAHGSHKRELDSLGLKFRQLWAPWCLCWELNSHSL